MAADAAAVNEERQTAEEVALGTLHLILVVVQESNAGPWLASSALLDALHAVARWLLSDEIRGQPFPPSLESNAQSATPLVAPLPGCSTMSGVA